MSIEVNLGAAFYVLGLGAFILYAWGMIVLAQKGMIKTVIVCALFLIALGMGLFRFDNSADADRAKADQHRFMQEKIENVEAPVLSSPDDYEKRMKERELRLKEGSKERIKDYLNEENEDEKN